MLCALEASLSVTTPRVETVEALLSSAQTGFSYTSHCWQLSLATAHRSPSRVSVLLCLQGYLSFCLSKMASGRLPSTQAVASV